MLNHRALCRALAVLAAAFVLSSAAHAQGKQKKSSSPADSELDDYLKRVGAAGLEQPATVGSLWAPSGPMATLVSDYKARAVGDLITVQLVDTFTAATNGENNTSRAFSTASGLTGLVGQLGAKSGLSNLMAGTSNTTLDGKGASTMSSNLQLNLAGHIVQVMPNGVMVVEAARDFTVGNDRQTVVVRGLVRPGDITSSNTVPSSAIASLDIQIKGKGAVADASARPNIVIRTLLKLLTF